MKMHKQHIPIQLEEDVIHTLPDYSVNIHSVNRSIIVKISRMLSVIIVKRYDITSKTNILYQVLHPHADKKLFDSKKELMKYLTTL